MEVDDILRLAGDEGSSLTRSFWFGKFLQLLSDKKIIQLDHPLESSSASPCSPTPSHARPKDEDLTLLNTTFLQDSTELLMAHVAEALKCLRHYETSLSPIVYDLVVSRSGTHCIPPGLLSSISESSFLVKDCTLDWDVVSMHLDKGRVAAHVTVSFRPIFSTALETLTNMVWIWGYAAVVVVNYDVPLQVSAKIIRLVQEYALT